MSLHVFQKTKLTQRLLWRIAAGRAHETVRHITPYLTPGEKILDVGAGLCDIALQLQQAGYQVTPLDIEDYSCTPLMHPVLYDGRTMPFKNKQFDTALILTVLHHVPASQQERVLQEAARVARRLIIIEDVHSSRLHKYATMLMDSLLNLEFVGHPHSNKSDAEWAETFTRLGFRFRVVKHLASFGILRHRVYVLEIRKATSGKKVRGRAY